MTPQHNEFCEKHSGIEEAIHTLKEQITKLDGRIWCLLVAALVQLCGIVAILLQNKL
ncbi:MAG: hypothetical protein WC373_08465 [Smithella sp.]|jgi:hypothetical protein